MPKHNAQLLIIIIMHSGIGRYSGIAYRFLHDMYVPMTVHQSSVHRPLLYMRYPDSVVQNSASLINYGIEVAVYVTLLTTYNYNL